MVWSDDACDWCCACHQAAINETEKLIGDSLRAHPENLFANIQEVKPKLMTGHYAFAYVFIHLTAFNVTYSQWWIILFFFMLVLYTNAARFYYPRNGRCHLPRKRQEMCHDQGRQNHFLSTLKLSLTWPKMDFTLKPLTNSRILKNDRPLLINCLYE